MHRYSLDYDIGACRLRIIFRKELRTVDYGDCGLWTGSRVKFLEAEF